MSNATNDAMQYSQGLLQIGQQLGNAFETAKETEAESLANKAIEQGMAKNQLNSNDQGNNQFGDIPMGALQTRVEDVAQGDINPDIKQKANQKLLQKQTQLLERSSAYQKLQAQKAKQHFDEGRRKVTQAIEAYESGDYDTATRVLEDVYNKNLRDGKLVKRADNEGNKFKMENYVTGESGEMDIRKEGLGNLIRQASAYFQKDPNEYMKDWMKHTKVSNEEMVERLNNATPLVNRNNPSQVVAYQASLPNRESGENETVLFANKPGAVADPSRINDPDAIRQIRQNTVPMDEAETMGAYDQSGSGGGSGSGSDWDSRDTKGFVEQLYVDEGFSGIPDPDERGTGENKKIARAETKARYLSNLLSSGRVENPKEAYRATTRRFGQHQNAVENTPEDADMETIYDLYRNYQDLHTVAGEDFATVAREDFGKSDEEIQQFLQNTENKKQQAAGILKGPEHQQAMGILEGTHKVPRPKDKTAPGGLYDRARNINISH